MRVASITWDEKEDKTKIVFSDQFISDHRVIHLDVLSDAFYALMDLHKKILEKEKTNIPKSITSGETKS